MQESNEPPVSHKLCESSTVTLCIGCCRDSDVEGMSDGFDKHTAYGAIDGYDDPSMGWSRWVK